MANATLPSTRRVIATIPAGLALAALAAGCGAEFKLPTEQPGNQVVRGDSTYTMIDTWVGMNGIKDILITQGSGSQLFLLFNPGTGPLPRGSVRGYPFTTPTPIMRITFPTLLNPEAMAASPQNIFVLDQGDSCRARANPMTGMCGDGSGGWTFGVSDLSQHWRVREYGLLGGTDTLGTFTDVTFAWVTGIAADAEGAVYVGGTAIIFVPDPVANPPLFTRTFQYRVYKYRRGPRYPGVFPPDRNMPGANWHRDTTWVIEEGSGVGTMVDPRGMAWGPAGGGGLYSADYGNNVAQRLSDRFANSGLYRIDGAQTDTTFLGPVDVAVDLGGFVYVADTGNRRVVRYSPDQVFQQKVNSVLDEQYQALRNPIAVAADDSLVYVGDPDLGKVVIYQRN